jgi:hypothetical protein
LHSKAPANFTEVNQPPQERPMKFAFLSRMAITVLLLFYATAGVAEEFIGFVKSLGGQALVLREGATMDVVAGMELKMGDILKTGENGSVGLIFSDDTIISMGPRTELAIEDYLFEPVDGQLGFIAKIMRGTISYLSGQIAKLAPESVQLKTPAAMIGVRGTQVLIKVD